MISTKRIAFYGKGGIGKSTIAANLSALAAGQGRRVLHIGCDPKADSTRLLTNGWIPTVLQQMEKKDKLLREDLVFPGKYGVQCVEAGGPEAGRGCAGLGITTAMDEMQRIGILDEEWDLIIYDVLGDVVCGGFSVPMRRQYADRVYVVTSADYMALYAANNILKGVRRYSREGRSLSGGMIFNYVRGREDLRIAHAFLDRTNTSLLTWLEEDPKMQKLDYQGKLFLDISMDSENGRRLQKASAAVEREECFPVPTPMEPGEMERFRKEMAEALYEECGEN